MKSANLFSYQELDRTLPIAGAILSVLLIIYTSVNIGRAIYAFTGVLTFISCLVWLKIRKNTSLELSQPITSSTNLLFVCLFFILFLLSILSLHFRSDLYERPLIYFVLMSLMVGAIVVESFSTKKQDCLILFQIILIGISVAWSQLLIFPSLVGVDPWYHQMFTLEILNVHFIPEHSGYSKLPIFHLFIGTTSLLTGLSYKFAAMLSVSLSQIICNVVFIYLLGKFLFNNRIIGLFASLFVVVANHHIFMSYWSIPNSFAEIFILIIFYLFLKVKQDNSISPVVLSILLLATVILTHAITSMFATISFFVFWATFNLYNFIYFKKDLPISLTYSTLFTVSMFAWWSFASGLVLREIGKLLIWGFSRDRFIDTTSEVFFSGPIVPIAEQFFNNMGMFLFFALSFIGCFYMISKKYGTHNTFAIAIVGLTPLFLGFFSLISENSIIEHRWWYFAQIFLSIPLAVSLLSIYNSIRNISIKPALVAVFIISLSFILIMSPPANNDNQIFSPNSSYRASFTESEFQAIYTISDVFDGSIGSDRYLVALNFLPINITIIPLDYELYSGNYSESSTKYILIRDYIEHNSFKVYNAPYRLDYSPSNKLEEHGFNKVYDCKSVGLFYIS
ncbi:hypothetical protein [Methanosarcina sp. 2.H.A.1B.4]|uniref:hypothetical protein n=1 Tax=Methanosarcina sp. 2.H.A.1B.4 TaxID=1483600 RepID=UPI000B2108FA|nr:hypothetical protein [Methanosarcina sp. 2.H.A.1B.4]